MIEIMDVSLALLAGFFLGAVFFWGLWWTIQKGITSQNPALWFAGSLLLRTGLTLAGIYFVSHGHWTRLAVCLLGFVIARVIALKWIAQAPQEESTALHKETRNAS